MVEKLRNPHEDNESKQVEVVEKNKKLKTFLDWLRTETDKFQRLMRAEKPKNDKEETTFEGITIEDLEGKQRDIKEEIAKSIYDEIEKTSIIDVLKYLVQYANVFNFLELSEMSGFIGSIILELDDSSPLKQKLLAVQKELKAMERIKASK